MSGSTHLTYISRARPLRAATCTRCGHKENAHTDLICRHCGKPLQEVPNVLLFLGLLVCIVLPAMAAHSPQYLGLAFSYYLAGFLVFLFIAFNIYVVRADTATILAWSGAVLLTSVGLWVVLFEPAILSLSPPQEAVGALVLLILVAALLGHLIAAYHLASWNAQSFRHRLFNFSFVYTVNVVAASFCAYIWPDQNVYLRNCVVGLLQTLPDISGYAGWAVHAFDLGFRYRFALLLGYIVTFMVIRAIREALREPVDMTAAWYHVVGAVIASVGKELVVSARPLALTWLYITRQVWAGVVPVLVCMVMIAVIRFVAFRAVSLAQASSIQVYSSLEVVLACLALWLAMPLVAYASARIRRHDFVTYYENQLRGLGRIYIGAHLGFFASGILLWLIAFVISGTASAFSWRNSLLKFNEPLAANMLMICFIVILGGASEWFVVSRRRRPASSAAAGR